MSTDLQLTLPSIATTNSSSNFGGFRDLDDEIARSEEECHTPRSPRHMIPAVLRCPPAPKKRRRSAACKRSLCELQFFEAAAREEVDSLFRTVQVNASSTTKGNCFSVNCA